MSRILLRSIIFSLVIVFAGLSVIHAQTAPVSGKVEVVKADGTREPVAGALVEPFRMDIKASAPTATTSASTDGRPADRSANPGTTISAVTECDLFFVTSTEFSDRRPIPANSSCESP